MSYYCAYDYCKFEFDSANPAEITDWGKLVEAMRRCGDRVLRVRKFDGRVFYKLRSYENGGSVLLSTSDARKLVKEYGIKLVAVYIINENGDNCSDDAYIDPAF